MNKSVTNKQIAASIVSKLYKEKFIPDRFVKSAINIIEEELYNYVQNNVDNNK
jgi:hypothetical protein